MQESSDRRLDRLPLMLLGTITLLLIWSGIKPADRMVWLLETFPVMLAAAILIPTYRRFTLARSTYIWIAVHAAILIVGGKYTYAEVPIGNWLRDTFDLSRNHYDRLGHFAQGFVPAIVAREVLLRTSPLRPGKWLFVIVVSICVAISALYELLEWGVAMVETPGSNAFLGTQGDIWDTQKDMALCLVGAVVAQGIGHGPRAKGRDIAPTD